MNLSVQKKRCVEPWYCDHIDDTLARFTEFKEKLKANGGFPTRITVTGEPGCGKKTFLARCLDHFVKNCNQRCDTVVVSDWEPDDDCGNDEVVSELIQKVCEASQDGELNSLAGIAQKWNGETASLILVLHNCNARVASVALNAFSLESVHIFAALKDRNDVKVIERLLGDEAYDFDNFPLGYVCKDSVISFVKHAICTTRLEDGDARLQVCEEDLAHIVEKIMRADKLHVSIHQVCKIMTALSDIAVSDGSNKIDMKVFQIFLEKRFAMDN